ncbi:hypothetical protein DYU11_07240 [Fibrisoma montanum]|uniref:Uncharacterized protein n=1 Tax=Fibrisoma montanum TaxID=2305895 RepID=A0A418MEA3_9BACT|nr:hypothetical protein [Fibrisoma montanum]RIV25106.1 hypothetical protein DYU11_07240 [Fibrisoma montanum]
MNTEQNYNNPAHSATTTEPSNRPVDRSTRPVSRSIADLHDDIVNDVGGYLNFESLQSTLDNVLTAQQCYLESFTGIAEDHDKNKQYTISTNTVEVVFSLGRLAVFLVGIGEKMMLAREIALKDQIPNQKKDNESGS